VGVWGGKKGGIQSADSIALEADSGPNKGKGGRRTVAVGQGNTSAVIFHNDRGEQGRGIKQIRTDWGKFAQPSSASGNGLFL